MDEEQYQLWYYIMINRKEGGWFKRAAQPRDFCSDEASDSKSGEVNCFVKIGFNNKADVKKAQDILKEVGPILTEIENQVLARTSSLLLQVGKDYLPEVDRITKRYNLGDTAQITADPKNDSKALPDHPSKTDIQAQIDLVKKESEEPESTQQDDDIKMASVPFDWDKRTDGDITINKHPGNRDPLYYGNESNNTCPICRERNKIMGVEKDLKNYCGECVYILWDRQETDRDKTMDELIDILIYEIWNGKPWIDQ